MKYDEKDFLDFEDKPSADSTGQGVEPKFSKEVWSAAAESLKPYFEAGLVAKCIEFLFDVSFVAQSSNARMWGGEVLAKQGFAEMLLSVMLLEGNAIVKSQKETIIHKINEALKSVPAGEELSEENAVRLAENIAGTFKEAAENER